jgi:hypothetical protein
MYEVTHVGSCQVFKYDSRRLLFLSHLKIGTSGRLETQS